MFFTNRIPWLSGTCKNAIATEKPFLWALSEFQLAAEKSILKDFVRSSSSKKKRFGNNNKTVKLAHQAYATPYKSEDTVPIVIVHGLLGSKNNWNTMAKALLKSTDDRMVISVDVRNHGDSPHTDEFSYELMVLDLLRFLNDKSIEKASLIGHSLGGRICMLLSLLYPHMVESLVVVDISPLSRSKTMMELRRIFNILILLQLNPTSLRQEARSHLRKNGLDENLINFLLTNLVQNGDNWRWKFNIKAISKNFESEICKFPIMISRPFEERTLFVGGSNSDYLKPQDETSIKVLFPNANFVYIQGAGHWVHAEKPQEFLNVVSEFLNNKKE